MFIFKYISCMCSEHFRCEKVYFACVKQGIIGFSNAYVLISFFRIVLMIMVFISAHFIIGCRTV